MINKIELLSPAANFDSLVVAINCGADAVYIGGKSFSARASAQNFTNEEIKSAVTYAHLRGKKVFVAINTLVFDDEFEELGNYIDFLYSAKVDALIVQDLGVLHFIKEKYPDFIIHASTQMSVCNKIGVEFLKKLGVSRVILARETSLDEVKKITTLGIEVEVFGHGAMCYAYSGNCLLSYAIGGRSGNRGACAQPCRKKYSLVENGKVITKDKPLMSMHDLCTIDHLPELIEAGITSLKVEGRLKSIEYIKETISFYRKKIDEYYNHQVKKITSLELNRLKVTFNRGFTGGYLLKSKNFSLTNNALVNHQGIVIGKVTKKQGKKLWIKLEQCLNFGDGIRFKGQEESGQYVNEIYHESSLVKEAFPNQIVMIYSNSSCQVGDLVYKTVDAKLKEEAQNLIKIQPLKIDISIKFTCRLNEKLKLNISDGLFEIAVETNVVSEKANKPMNVERIKEQLSKTNDTCFRVNQISIDYDDISFVTIKELNDIRRIAINKLSEIRINNVKRELLPIGYFLKRFPKINKILEVEAVVENEFQMRICQECGIKNVYLNHDRFIDNISNSFLVHSVNTINDNSNVLSYYMNIVNSKGIELVEKMGFSKVYLSPEVSLDVLNKISIRNCNLDLGMIVYGRIDLMVTNHCMIAKEKKFEDKKCQSCVNNEYHLIDEQGNVYPIIGNYPICHIRVLSSKPIDLSTNILNLQKNGINKFLLCFTKESENEIRNIIRKYQKLIKNTDS